MLVDLSTTERDLEDLMLSEYPEILKGEQIVKSREGKNKVYCFLGLDYRVLTEFLIQQPYCKFTILEHSTERVIETNRNFNNPYFYH